MEIGFNQFLESMNFKMKDMFVNFLQGVTGEQVKRRGGKGSSSRYKLDTPATRGSIVSNRPAPAQRKGKKVDKEDSSLSEMPRVGSDQPLWTKVLGRKAKKKDKQTKLVEQKVGTGTKVQTTQSRKLRKSGGEQKSSPPAIKNRRIPRTAAVIITCPKGQYAETMRDTRESSVIGCRHQYWHQDANSHNGCLNP